MKSKTHALTEQLVAATAPIFKKSPDYETIFHASCLWFARIIQATPDRGEELELLEEAHHHITHALTSFLELEKEAALAKAASRDRVKSAVEQGIEGFGNLAVVNGSEPGPALVGKFPFVEGLSTEDKNDVASAIEESLGKEAEEEHS